VCGDSATAKSIGPRAVYGEILHARGANLARLRRAGVPARVGPSADREVGAHFERPLREHGLQGAYWHEFG
jgi:hypothetical protein